MSDIPLAIKQQPTEDIARLDNIHSILADTFQLQSKAFSGGDLKELLRETSEDIVDGIENSAVDSNESQEQNEEKRMNRFGEFFGKLGENISSGISTITENSSGVIASALLGPMRTLIEPFGGMQKVTGLIGSAFGKIGAGVSRFKDHYRGSITRNTISKIDPGAVYIADQLAGDKTDPEKAGGIGQTILDALGFGATNSILSKLSGLTGLGLAGMGAIAAIAAGLIWAVIDGIRAWFLASDWGVSNIIAFIGGFLAGTGTGWKSAFLGMGKWALVGAGTGFLVGGPIGALVGGLIGAAIGGIVGYFGGEKVANVLQSIDNVIGFVKFFTDFAYGLVAPIINLFNNIKDTVMNIFDIWKNDGSVINKIIDTVKEIGIGIFKSVYEFTFDTTMIIVRWFMWPFFLLKNAILGQDFGFDDLINNIVGVITSVKNWFVNIAGIVGGWFTGMFNYMFSKENLKKIKGLGNIIGEFIKNVASSVGNWIKKAIYIYFSGVSSVIQGGLNLFDIIKDKVVGIVNSLLTNQETGDRTMFGRVVDSVIGFVTKGLTMIGNFFSFIVESFTQASNPIEAFQNITSVGGDTFRVYSELKTAGAEDIQIADLRKQVDDATRNVQGTANMENAINRLVETLARERGVNVNQINNNNYNPGSLRTMQNTN